MRVEVITGDDLIEGGSTGDLQDEAGNPLKFQSPLSANAYLGAAPLAEAMAAGADVIVTGRVADPALALAPFIHHHGWSIDDYHLVASGTLAGHLLECGEIGRASCRERVCQYVEVSVVDVTLIKKTTQKNT